MHIQELHNTEHNKTVTVTFMYNEIRDLSNGLFQCIQSSEDNENKYLGIYCKSKILFDMIKHGNIQPETIKRLSKLNI